MTEKIFKIVLDDQNKAKVKLDSNSFLSDIRKKLKEKIDSEFLFMDNEKFPLEKDLENELKIIDLKTDLTIFLKSISVNEIKKEIKLKIERKIEPLPDSKLIRKEGKLNIYQYPIINFTPIEEANAYIVLIVGQTGCGKTTFINAFVNYLMDIELSDNFRYSLIVENGRIKKEVKQKVCIFIIFVPKIYLLN